MLPVLDLDPAIAPAASISALAMLRDQSFEAHQAGMSERLGTDLTLLAWSHEDPLRTQWAWPAFSTDLPECVSAVVPSCRRSAAANRANGIPDRAGVTVRWSVARSMMVGLDASGFCSGSVSGRHGECGSSQLSSGLSRQNPALVIYKWLRLHGE